MLFVLKVSSKVIRHQLHATRLGLVLWRSQCHASGGYGPFNNSPHASLQYVTCHFVSIRLLALVIVL